jgi:hypothetical protein
MRQFTASLFFMRVVAVMGYELSLDVFRAARLGHARAPLCGCHEARSGITFALRAAA